MARVKRLSGIVFGGYHRNAHIISGRYQFHHLTSRLFGTNSSNKSSHILVQVCPKVDYEVHDCSVDLTVKPGDFIEKGQVYGSMETDKICFDMKADMSGYVSEIFVEDENTVIGGEPLFSISSTAFKLNPDLPMNEQKWLSLYHTLIHQLHGSAIKVSLENLDEFQFLMDNKDMCPFSQDYLLWNYAQACFLSGNYNRAKEITQLISTADNADILPSKLQLLKGNIYFATGEPDIAITLFQKSLDASGVIASGSAASDVEASGLLTENSTSQALAMYGLALTGQVYNLLTAGEIRDLYEKILQLNSVPLGIRSRMLLQYHWYKVHVDRNGHAPAETGTRVTHRHSEAEYSNQSNSSKEFKSTCMSPFVADIINIDGASSQLVLSTSTDITNTQSLQIRSSRDVIEVSIDSAADIILRNGPITFFTGAGISKASGLPTRQDLWEYFNRQNAVSIDGAVNNPRYIWEVIQEFYKDPVAKGRNYLYPNDAHIAINNMCAMLNVNGIVTQNVDNLHQMAMFKGHNPGRRHNTSRILELHGTMDTLYCVKCGKKDFRSALDAVFFMKEPISRKGKLPNCRECERGILLPNVVLFGERVPLHVYTESLHLLAHSECVIVSGTALDVAPAAALVSLSPGVVIDFNTSEPQSGLVDYWVRGEAEHTLKELVQVLVEKSYKFYKIYTS